MGGRHVNAIIIDDHLLFSEGMRHLVLSLDDVTTAQNFTRPDDAMSTIAASTDLKLIISDFYIPGFDMGEWINKLKNHYPGVPIAVVSSSISRADRTTSLAAGAKAYFEKQEDPEVVLVGFQKLLQAGRIADPMTSPSMERITQYGLTDRQGDILVLLARGLSVKEVARDLKISAETVKTHLSKIYRVLNVYTRSEAAQWARNNGFV